MTAFVDGKRLNDVSLAGVSLSDVLCFAEWDERDEMLAAMRIGRLKPILERESSVSHFGSYEDFDYLCVKIPDFDDAYESPSRVDIFLYTNRLIVLHNNQPIIQKLLQMAEISAKPIPPEELLYHFFTVLSEKDSAMLDELEEEIIELEDELTDGTDPDFPETLSDLRRRLLSLKRYYEGLCRLFGDLEENKNNLISRDRLHLFRLHTNLAHRFSQTVLYLNESLNLVREAHQTRTDISATRAIRLLAILTALFLPLHLIVGWYGMNFDMPEYLSAAAYPVIIGISVLLTGGILFFLKRKKWF